MPQSSRVFQHIYLHSWPLLTTFASYIFFKSHTYTSEIPVRVIQRIQALLSSIPPHCSKKSFKNAQLNTLSSFQLSLEAGALDCTFAVQLLSSLEFVDKVKDEFEKGTCLQSQLFQSWATNTSLNSCVPHFPTQKQAPSLLHAARLQSIRVSEWGLSLTVNLSNNDSNLRWYLETLL